MLHNSHTPHHRAIRTQRQRGFTIVELMVAVFLMLLVTIATVALYTVNSQSSKTVDAVASLDDSARFIFEIMGRAIQTAGYREVVRTRADVTDYSSEIFSGCVTTNEPCPLLGFDNSIVTAGNFGSAGSGLFNLSDSLAIRFAGSGQPSGAANGSTTDCQGAGTTAPDYTSGVAATARDEMISMSFFISTATAAVSTEPELYCRSGVVNNSIASGVETLQFLYAIDIDGDSVPNRWVRGTDIINWTQVRAVRVGFVLRGEPGSAQSISTAPLYPLGQEFSQALGGDAVYTPPADNRLRKVFTATFFMRNEI
jgi:type IV pilus assembly protein PilW